MNKVRSVVFVAVLYLCLMLNGCGDANNLANGISESQLELQEELTEAIQESVNKVTDLQLELDIEYAEKGESVMQDAEVETKVNLDNCHPGRRGSPRRRCRPPQGWPPGFRPQL